MQGAEVVDLTTQAASGAAGWVNFGAIGVMALLGLLLTIFVLRYAFTTIREKDEQIRQLHDAREKQLQEDLDRTREDSAKITAVVENNTRVMERVERALERVPV